MSSNDSTPMWSGNKIYFRSDRSGPISLFAYDTVTKQVTQVVKNAGLDIKSASAGPGAIVYEQFGSIHLFDPATGQEKAVSITLTGDMTEVRPRLANVAGNIENANLSPSGVRAVFEARGEIFTVPADKGEIRNLTNTPGVAERDPAWSPDGKWVAYFSDESGDYALHLRDPQGKGEVKKIALGTPSFFYSLVWSPDSKKIAFTDKRLNYWMVDIEKGVPVKVDTNLYERQSSPVWSPDSRWLAYIKQLKSHMRAVFVYSVSGNKATQITDGLSDAGAVDFDKGGKYLYFTASTDSAITRGWLDMSMYERPVTSSVYVVVLRKDLPSPLAPESDEEKPKEEPTPPAPKPDAPKRDAAKPETPKPAEKKESDEVRIDFEDIGQRIVALPIPQRNFGTLAAGKAGTLFLLEVPQMRLHGSSEAPILSRFDLTARKFEPFLTGIGNFALTASGDKMLYQQGARWAITGTAGPANPVAGTLNLSRMEARIDPRAEWQQIYREVWRIERDFFYAPNYHGLDLKATAQRYAPYVAGLHSRHDLNYLFEEMLGELTVGHMFIAGGDLPGTKSVPVGLLGADYRVENGRYRFAKIYQGENYNPGLVAPLTQPGVNVRTGEYLLAVNGVDALPSDEVYRYFEATAGKQTTLRVGPTPDGKGARDVVVVPIPDETNLRYREWIEGNRRKVDQMSGGRIAYVHLPDTNVGGYTNFNRYFFAQVGKEGIVVDERFNGGGSAADYIIDYLKRPLMNYFAPRDGMDFTTPTGAIFGPKAMIINEMAGSGGDLMPWMFRKAGIGPLIGKRTWGGLVGIGGYPPLIDGGFVTAPHFAFWNPNGTWDVENHGVDPDIEVEYDPEAVRTGRDPQLEKAVEVVLAELAKNPLPKHTRPAYPDYQTKH